VIAVDDASGAVVVMGWAFDHSNLYTTVTAAVTLDGAIVTGASANLPSPYLYPYGVPGSHAFFSAFTTSNGPHEVCVIAVDQRPGTDTLVACSKLDVEVDWASKSPQGDFSLSGDELWGQITVVGWAFDHSALSASITVDITVDGSSRGRAAATLPSTYLYPYGVPGSHAFVAGFGVGSGSHKVCVTAIDVAPGKDVALGCKTLTLSVVQYSPEGPVQIGIDAKTGVISITGWVIDRSRLGVPIKVAVAQNGVLMASFYANWRSPDLDPYSLPYQGLNAKVNPLVESGPDQVCVYGFNIGPGSDSALACADLTVKQQTGITNAGPSYFSQTDPAWAGIRIGVGLIGPTGCVPTSTAMALRGFGIDVNPVQVATLMNAHGDYNRGGAGASGYSIVTASQYYGIPIAPIYSIDQFRQALKANKTVIAIVDPPLFTNPGTTHAIAVYGIDQNGMAMVSNPAKLGGAYSVGTIWANIATDPAASYDGAYFWALG